jgi:hypothetical protein
MMSRYLPEITESRLYFTLYFLISAATFRHSTEGFASFEGSLWLGALCALAVDALMILFAHSLRRKFRWTLLFAMCFPAGLSVYTQLLYAVNNAQIMEIAPGALWLEQVAVDIINARVWLLPISLPVSALLAALVGENQQEETVPVRQLRDLQNRLKSVQAALTRVEDENVSNEKELDRLRQANQGHEEFMAWASEPEHFKSARSFGRWALRVCDHVGVNGDGPTAVIVGETTGKTAANFRADIAEIKAERAQAKIEN